MILPGIMAGALLAYGFVIMFFANGPGSTTLPIYVYEMHHYAPINALSTVWVSVVFIAVLLLQILQNRDLLKHV